jgi:hypothetical protein
MRHTRMTLRLLLPIAIALTAGVLAACGGSEKGPPVGSAQKPLVGDTTPAGSNGSETSSTKPGYEKLLERQTSKPQSRFTPCNLVSKAQARAILGAAIQDPLEAPQGPTCIYRTRDGKAFITLAVQPLRFSKLKAQLADRRAVTIASRTAYCGRYGQPMLYLPLSSGRVLSVAARCAVAKKFATTALGQLGR